MNNIDREREDSLSDEEEDNLNHQAEYKNGQKEMYAVSATYEREIDEWYKSERSEDESFILGSTGGVLQGLGAIESDIYINSDKIVNIFKKHKEITIDEIKKIPEILEDPVLILKSQNNGAPENKIPD